MMHLTLLLVLFLVLSLMFFFMLSLMLFLMLSLIFSFMLSFKLFFKLWLGWELGDCLNKHSESLRSEHLFRQSYVRISSDWHTFYNPAPLSIAGLNCVWLLLVLLGMVAYKISDLYHLSFW